MVDVRNTLVLGVLLAACRPTPSTPPNDPTSSPPTAPVVPTTITTPPWSLTVGDGSGNVFVCEHAVGGAPRYEYRPVTPEQSSSGTYSGGEPRSGALSPDDVDAMWRLVEAAVAKTAEHTEARNKGTVAIEADGPTDASVILTADGGADLVAWLHARP